MKKLLFFWQLPQNLIGFIFYNMIKDKIIMITEYKHETVYIIEKIKLLTGVSLGQFVFLQVRNKRTEKHERGHCKQSRIFGWFYLLLVGLPSIILNIISRFKRINYYSYWPEWHADKLGGVDDRND